MDNRPIGIFDSGIGGLTVLREYQKLLPYEDFIYYADTLHLPYGEKTKEQIISYVENIIDYLLQQNVKAIVFACGTASSYAYPLLKDKYPIPLFDVITPTAKGIRAQNIGIIATQGSVQSHVWEKVIQQYHPSATIHSIACPSLVPIAEKGHASTLRGKIAIHHYLKEFSHHTIDTLLLGCTHYPFFQKWIEKELRKYRFHS